MLRPLALAVLLALAACSTKHVSLSGKLKYQGTPEENYQAGLELLKDKSFPEAIRFFEYVKTKYPFSKQAPLAELRIADARFDQHEYAQAADAYGEFVRLHPTNEEVDYAEYRIGLAHLKEAPGDWMLFPPSYEKDLRQVQVAADSLSKFVERYPKSKYLPDASKSLEEARSRLAAHDWYVGEFYFKRKRWAGAAGRYEELADKYPTSRHATEALLKLARSCIAMDEKHRARTALQKLIVEHPQDPRRPEAERLLASLR
jgi:outer membrane protein assembly factor BamD